MTVPDPDEAPTRHGDPVPAAPDPSEERTVPAMEPKPGAGARASGPAGAAANGAGASATPSARPRAAGAADPLLGKVIGGCRIERLLGKGAMGAVYQARQIKLDRDVAVKVIRPEMMTDQRMLKRFEVEARTVGKFNSAHVVMVHDVGFEHGVHWLVMEFVQGKNLRDHVKLLAGGRLPVGEALPLLRQAIKGLEEAQRLDVIHRDIKPDNLMITDRGVLKIADFGIAKPLTEDFSMTLTSELVGTPLYMSPEQCQGEAELDFRSDMYSLGATFYYLLTGEPPIRASSVYELIQTKTKLAHLCLWKALPGLDENNPLSRVIERMTALDREDRYGSYEQLLNDLVLVEQGQTIHVPESGAAAKARAKAKAQARLRRRVTIGVAAVLLAAGGGYAYQVANRPEPPPVLPAAPVAGPDVAAVRSQLGSFRARLRDAGPDEALQQEIEQLTVPPDLVAERAALARDVATGLVWQQALAAITPPATLEPPFEELQAHGVAVARAAEPLPPAAGPELRAWRDKALADKRAEPELGGVGLAKLTKAWGDWQRERPLANADPERLGELEARLRVIELGRDRLRDFAPRLRVQIDDAVPRGDLDDARANLAKTEEAAPAVDVAESIAAIERALAASGPSGALTARAQALKPTQADQIAAHNRLLNALTVAAGVSAEMEGLRVNKLPTEPKPPFNDVDEYWQRLEVALEPVRAEGKVPQWAIALRDEKRAERLLETAVVVACGKAFQAWKDRKPEVDPGPGIDRLREAKARAIQLFPGAKDAVDVAIPDAALASAQAELAAVAKKQRWLIDAEKLGRQLASVATYADWKTNAPSATESLGSLRASATELAGAVEVTRELTRLAAIVDSWQAVVARIKELDQKLVAGDLRSARTVASAGLAGTQGRDEFVTAMAIVDACASAFDTFGKTLNAESAAGSLENARGKLLATAWGSEAEPRLTGWLQALQRLRTATADMVAIPAGRPKGGVRMVDSFFLAATECSRQEYAQFLAELRAAVAAAGADADAQKRFDAVSARLEGAGMSPDRLRELLERDVRPDKTPMDNVTWHAAAAYAAWYGRALPTAAEWSVAAFGDNGKYTYPWGNDWSNDPQQRNPSNTKLQDVDFGGLSWRQADGVRLHHLAGNVAEWLAGEPGSRQGALAGGRYTDTSETAAKEYSSGARWIDSEKADARKGFGFRTVLRPRSYPGLQWPQE
jgi:formylglycine-generating enzyme required for sulfatase activity/tRNA A-37 threonylcarbamoyl transferase component Bud32